MHNTQTIVGETVSQCFALLFEIILHVGFDVVPFDCNVGVSVWSALNMECSKSVEKFMLDCTMEDESESFDVSVSL